MFQRSSPTTNEPDPPSRRLSTGADTRSDPMPGGFQLAPRTIRRSALVFVAVYALLTGLYRPVLESRYPRWFRTLGNSWFSTHFWFWPDGNVHFLDNSTPTLVADVAKLFPVPISGDTIQKNLKKVADIGDRDTLLVLINESQPASFGLTRTSSRFIGYAPTVMLVALAVATPIAWRRRVWLLGGGLVLVQGLILVRLTAVILKNGFATEQRFALFHPSKFWWDIIRRADAVLADDPTFAYMVAILPWILALLVVNGYFSLHARLFATKRSNRGHL